jgi:hypothetical protein
MYKNINKFNDAPDGNPFGHLIKGDNKPADNGRTPINPDADKSMSVRVETHSASGSTKGFTPTKA